jgi:hypothetical protein
MPRPCSSAIKSRINCCSDAKRRHRVRHGGLAARTADRPRGPQGHGHRAIRRPGRHGRMTLWPVPLMRSMVGGLSAVAGLRASTVVGRMTSATRTSASGIGESGSTP